MTKEHYTQIMQAHSVGHYVYLANFVKMLAKKIPLDYIDINDWQCNLRPSVYVHNQQNMFNMRRYSRCSPKDIKRAVKFSRTQF